MSGPILDTERLELRWMTLDDTAMMFAVWNDPAFMQFVGDRGIRTLEEAEASMQQGPLNLYAEYGYGPFRVIRRDNGADIGVCGLYRRDGLDEPDIGFAFLPEHRGKGFGFEASVAVLDHARDVLKLPRITAIVSPENVASIALLEKLGMTYDKAMRLPGDDEDVSLYVIDFTN